jgi:hypothetical protein
MTTTASEVASGDRRPAAIAIGRDRPAIDPRSTRDRPAIDRGVARTLRADRVRSQALHIVRGADVGPASAVRYHNIRRCILPTLSCGE